MQHQPHVPCVHCQQGQREQPPLLVQLLGTVSSLCLQPFSLTVSCCCSGMGKARHGSGAGGPGELRQSVKVGKLNLVDLAGSERVHITGATGWPNQQSSTSTLSNYTPAMLLR